MRTTLLEQDRFRKLKWLPSSVPFTCARVREFDQSDQSLYKEHTVYMMYTVYMMHKGKQDENCVAQRLFEEETSE